MVLIDCNTYQVQVGDRHVNLTPKEFDTLLRMAQHPSWVFSPGSLSWSYDTAKKQIQRLRAKIGKELIVNRHGFGWAFIGEAQVVNKADLNSNLGN